MLTVNNSVVPVVESIKHKAFSASVVISLFIAIGIVTLSLRVVTIFDGYVVTLAAFIIMLYWLKMLNHVQRRCLVSYLLLNCFLLVNALGHATTLDYVEFIKSFLLTSVMLFVYITSLHPRGFLITQIRYGLILRVATYAIVGFEIIQIFEQFVLNSYSSWFWLDGQSISTADNIGRFQAVYFPSYYRPVSFFHEPSYLAAVSFVLLLINDRTVRIKHINVLLIASIILSVSAIGTVMLIAYLAVKLLFGRRDLLIFALIMSAVMFVVSGNEIFSYLRFGEIFKVGTSGYYRLVEPLVATGAILSDFPFGLPLGQSEIVFNNSLYLVFLYFGAFTVFLIATWVVVVWSRIRHILFTINYALGVMFLLLVNGAIFTIESAFLILLLNYSFLRTSSL